MSTKMDPLDQLRAKIVYHSTEADRLQGVLDAVLREVEAAIASYPIPAASTVTPPLASTERFRWVPFATAVATVLNELGPLSTSGVTDALLAGGYPTTSLNPKRNFGNMLDQLPKGTVIKLGDRFEGIRWALPHQAPEQARAEGLHDSEARPPA